MIEKYYQSLLDFLAACAIVQSFELGLDKRSSVLAFVRGDVYFADDSRLHFRELVDTRQLPVRDMYAYHYQSADGALLFRYDNTPHYPDLPSFPHHKHVAKGPKVISSNPQDLFSVIREIEEIIVP